MLRILLCFPAVASASNTFGAKFLSENKGKDGVITLPSGLQYKVLRAGHGSDHPTLDSPCSCHYEGRTAENYPLGRKFDSSYDRGQPATFAPKQVIRGWTIAMQLMVEGDKWEMYIPSDLAYGARGRPPKIPGGAVLVFTMEIIKIKGRKIPAKQNSAVIETAKITQDAATPGGSQVSAPPPEPQVQDFGNGMKLSVIKAGDGKTFPHPGDLLTMHYTLTLSGDASGKVIDSSRSRNEPFTFTIGVGQVIRGWDQGVMKMSLGERGTLLVPSALGYGARGAGRDIPPNADLSFDLEVLAIDGTHSSLGIGAVVILTAVVGTVLLFFLAWRCASKPSRKAVPRTVELGIGRPAE